MDAISTTSNRFVDLTILVPLPPNLINRDDGNRPKTTTVGGVERLAPSTQSTMRGLQGGSKYGKSLVRTKFLPATIVHTLCGGKIPASDKFTDVLYSALCSAMYDNTKKEGEESKKQADKQARDAKSLADKAAAEAASGKTSTPKKAASAPAAPKEVPVLSLLETAGLILMTQEEIDTLVTALEPSIREALQTEKVDAKALEQLVKDAFAKCRCTSSALVLGLRGRMVTNSGGKIQNAPDGAMQMGLPFSVDRARIQTDFYSAVDDQKKKLIGQEPEFGAAHLGERDFSGGNVMLIQFQINLDLMARNAGFNSREEAVKAFPEDIVNIVMDVIETATFRPFAGAAAQGNYRTSPRAHYAILRGSMQGAMYDYAPCFETPVSASIDTDEPIRVVAAKKLVAYHERAQTTFQEPMETVLFTADEGLPGLTTRDTFLKSAQALIEKILA